MNELLVLTFNGMRYGVWKDSILSVEDVKTLHRLPLSPACIAGMTILEGRTATLADLSVCIGLPAIKREKSGRILLMSKEEKVAGFVVEGEIGHLTIGPDNIFPIPDYLKTALINTCAVHSSGPIPVINLSLLYSRIQKAETEPPIAEFPVPATERRDIASVKSVRLFECGKEHFASPAAGIEEEAVGPGQTSRLALIPPQVKGLSFLRESVLPLISLSRKMKLLKPGSEGLVLVAEIGGARFAFSVDADEGTLFGKDFTIKPLPPLVESNWIRGAVVRAGDILPLIDLGALMSARADGADERPLPERYSPDSRFPFLFGKEDAELVEFSLLGARHALPKTEVEDTVQFRPYRQVPNVQPIVVGVTEHDGGLLPVLDLAMCFGRRSLVTPDWSMLLVKNGDFRALVITEAVFGERRLELNAQRGVPMVLPHRVVYGCYPDAAVVRLVLNVEALAVHFDKALVKDLLRALSKEMEQAPSEIVSSLLEPEVIGAQAGREAAVFAQEIVPEEADVPYQETIVSDEKLGEEEEEALIAAQEQIEDPVLSAPVEAAVIPEAIPAPVQDVVEPVATGVASEPEPEPEPEPMPVPEERPAAPVFSDAEKPELPVGAESEREEQDGGVAVQDEQARSIQAGDRAGEENLVPVIEEEPVRTDSLPDVAATEEASEEKMFLTEAIADAEQIQVVPSLSQEEVRVSVSQELPGEEHMPERVVSAVPLETGEADEERAAGKKEAASIAEQLVFQRGYERREQVSESAAAEYLETSSARRWKGSLPYIIIVVILIAVLSVSGVFKKSTVVREAQEAKAQKVRVEKPKPAVKPPARKPAPVEPPKPVAAAGPAVVFSGSRVYVVKKGDTLWAISKRFTGNPFNFPQVAKENNIKDPDIIFPGQEIRL
jgi:chemotaxis signal transduction protein/LysM repeat protein